MSQDPVSALPLPPAERPGSVTAMAVIGIIFGAMGFICTPLSVIPYFINLPQTPQGNPVMDAIKNDSIIFTWTMMASLMNWLLSIVLLTGSIAALGLREWARQLLIGWSLISMLLAIAGVVFNLIYLQPKLLEILRSQGSNPAAAAGAVGGMVGIVLTVVFGIGVPALMLFIMTRPKVKDAFARGLRPVI